MPKKQHTHRGHCQVCGRIQAAQEHDDFGVPFYNTVAKHGYKVAGFHYFAGTCQGSDKRPMQESRELADQIAASLLIEAARHDRVAAEFKAGSRHPVRCATNRMERNTETGKLQTVLVMWEAASEAQRTGQVEREVWHHDSQASFARGHSLILTELAKQCHGQPLIPTAAVALLEIQAGQTFTVGSIKSHSHSYTVLRKGGARRWACQRDDGKVHQFTAVTIRSWLKRS